MNSAKVNESSRMVNLVRDARLNEIKNSGVTVFVLIWRCSQSSCYSECGFFVLC